MARRRESTSQILHVVVVGFHHKKGSQVEYAYPPLPGSSLADGSDGAKSTDEYLPPAWRSLPSLALPDGAHNVEQDVVYFLLPSRDDPTEAIYGISCFRQIASEALLSRTEDVTRSTVQKSVCVLSRTPLWGVLHAKLEVITQAYFNEKDFSKVEVLAQMYGNLHEMFDGDGGDLVDGQGAMMDISVRDLVRTFRHRCVLLFKLLLLEKRVLFHIFPVTRLGDTQLALLSLFPGLVERGLRCSQFIPSRPPTPEEVEEEGEDEETMGMGGEKEAEVAVEAQEFDVAANSMDGVTGDPQEADKEKTDEEKPSEEVSKVDGQASKSDANSITKKKKKQRPLDPDPLATLKDGHGFPLTIFTEGLLFSPYIGLASLDTLKNPCTRGFVVGATNALLLQLRENFDVIVSLDEAGVGSVDIVNGELKKALSLTSADLRFADYLIKNVEATEEEAPVFDGGSEWIREQFRAYLLSLGASVRSGLVPACNDFGAAFVGAWRETRNCRRWLEEGRHEDLAGFVPGHAFAGQLGVYDVMLRVEHSVGGSEQARKALSALSSTGKSIGATGERMKSGFTSWLKGVTTQASAALAAASTPTAQEAKEEPRMEDKGEGKKEKEGGR